MYINFLWIPQFVGMAIFFLDVFSINFEISAIARMSVFSKYLPRKLSMFSIVIWVLYMKSELFLFYLLWENDIN